MLVSGQRPVFGTRQGRSRQASAHSSHTQALSRTFGSEFGPCATAARARRARSTTWGRIFAEAEEHALEMHLCCFARIGTGNSWVAHTLFDPMFMFARRISATAMSPSPTEETWICCTFGTLFWVARPAASARSYHPGRPVAAAAASASLHLTVRQAPRHRLFHVMGIAWRLFTPFAGGVVVAFIFWIVFNPGGGLSQSGP